MTRSMNFELSGNIVDVVAGRILQGTVRVENGRITSVREHPVNDRNVILPGLIDAHIHIESSMLIPSEFARMAVVHGTTATVSDPHEIANVLGAEGVRFMIRNGAKVPFRFNFGAPSCVPATSFETSGAGISTDDVEELLGMKEVRYLSEMMNFPGVLHDDPAVMNKLELARSLGKPVDGHAPGLGGKELEKYVGSGITTDHECVTLEEAVMKAGMGMKILIREGSAAKNFEALCPMIATHPAMVMFCSDDKHPDDLAGGHINKMVARALSKGFDPVDVLRCCTLNPVVHYNLDSGLLQTGDPADIVVVNSLESFEVLSVYVGGILVACEGRSLIEPVAEEPLNRFSAEPVTPADLAVPAKPSDMQVIRAYDGQLFTGSVRMSALVKNGEVISDTTRDILKLVVVNRYHPAPPAVAFITGFGLKRGAIASCVAHDSHNIVAVGVDDGSIARAVNLVIESRGGIALADGEREMVLQLPFAGIMSGADGSEVALQYGQLDRHVKEMGTSLKSPYMTLSFMALLVIPEMKLSDKGLFDGTTFSFTPLFPGSL
jgi:adenine deaminase